MKRIYSLSLLVLIFSVAGLGSIFSPSKVFAGDSSGGLVPNAPHKVWAKPGPLSGEVTLYWDGVNYADRYGVAYGTKSNWYIYGAENIGGEQARRYTVKSLTPGVKYYFKMIAAHSGASSPFSYEVSAVAKGGSTQVAQGTSVARVGEPVGQPTVKPQVSVSGSKWGPVAKENLWAKAGPKVGEVTLYWSNVSGADNYHLVYGTKMGAYQYGALNLGNVRTFTVGYLTPGTKYYFALVPVMNNTPQYTTVPVGAWAKSNVVEVIQTTKEALAQPKVSIPLTSPSAAVPTGTSAVGTSSAQPTTPAGL